MQYHDPGGETEGYTAADHVDALLSHGAPGLVDLCLANSAPVRPGLVEKYRDNDKKARWFVAQSVIFNLLLLGFFKYGTFLADNLYLLTGIQIPESVQLLGLTIPLRNVPLPIGISFYTFQTMSYTIDVYRKDAPVQRNMVDFGAFVTMFPQLIAGPIVQYKTVAAELVRRVHSSENFALGARRFCVGLAKKVLLANAIGALWEDCLAAQGAGELTVLGGWMGLFAFGFQIYFDFSGYSDMAIGLGRIFGFRFNENFDYPYLGRVGDGVLAAVAYVPDHLVPGVSLYPSGGVNRGRAP